jgi:WD40 repeat protein
MGNPGPEERPTVPAGGPSSSSGRETPAEIPRAQTQPPAHGFPLPRFPNHYRGARRYEILGEHGRGGLGRVSRAFDRKLGRDVAIKELHSRGSANEVRFLREVLITARLEHPSIVPIHEAGRWPDGTPYYAMKLVSGRSLRELIAERPTFEQRIGLLHHVIAVADAIAYAHGRNIIHRDLKPANVIVGDFGETIVIDWGLAKDLTTPDLAPEDHDDFTHSHDGDITVDGSIVGTPAYMAPEQKRGESVDQRADVFALGTMLWELCAVQKVPPKGHLRTRMLRRAGVDSDFAAIINKALDPDRERRYPDASALAADLKAFKSGARITARDYTFFAMLAHWTRRHRTLALSAAAAVLLAVAGSLLYVRNIAVERDRADRSLDELTLKHAELLLATDPSAAVDALMSYHGTDRVRAEQIRAEAVARGTAFVRAFPHTNTVMWTDVDPDGAILSLSLDGTIARTYFDGRSVVLTRGVSKIGMSSYSRPRHLLAYTCDPADLCVFDFVRSTRTALASVLQGASVNGASFSPDGTILAVSSQDGTLRLLDVNDPTRPTVTLVKSITGISGVEFIDGHALVASVEGGVELVGIDGSSERLALSNVARWNTSATEHQVAITTAAGQTVVIEPFPARIVARTELCRGAVTNLRFVPGRRGIAYACREGTVGIWEPKRDVVRVRAQLEGHADFITTSPTGEYIVAAGGNGTVTVIDLVTDLVASYKGHGFRLLSITPPSADHAFIVSADVRGAVRAWRLPSRLVRVAATSASPFLTAIFDNWSNMVATTWQPTLTVFSPANGTRTIGPHEPLNRSLERSDTGRTFATYGSEDRVEIWSSATMARTHVLSTGHGSVSQLSFVTGTEDFITAGHDGRLIRWTPHGDRTDIAHFHQPIDKFAVISSSDDIVFSTVDGTLWRTEHGARPQTITQHGARITRIVAIPSQHRVYVGYASGDVISIDTASWQQETLLHGPEAVREIATTDDGHTIAVATNEGTVHLGTSHRASSPGAWTWEALQVRARDIALMPDGLLVATSTDGAIWLYSLKQHWLCIPTGTADLGKIAVTSSGKAAVSPDREGRVLWIDLDAARNFLE